MKARAPGKVVISGAYSVLTGAPAIVSAVDRYVEADSERPAVFVTEEMRAAGAGPYPFFDASALRQDDRKLGLGSSAAILVAVLACQEQADLTSSTTQAALFARALAAHRSAQGGGSGVDVAASTYGGTLVCRLPEALRPGAAPAAIARLPEVRPVTLPALHWELWASPWAAKTGDYLRQVFAWVDAQPQLSKPLFTRLHHAAESAAAACDQSHGAELITALNAQAAALDELGKHSGADIFVPPVRQLAQLAQTQGCCVLPAGAGGGDITLYVGDKPPSSQLQQARAAAGLTRLNARLHAAGAHRT